MPIMMGVNDNGSLKLSTDPGTRDIYDWDIIDKEPTCRGELYWGGNLGTVDVK